MNIDEIIRNKTEILEKLRSKNKKEREEAWEKIKFLVDTGNGKLLQSDLGYLRSLLWHRLQGIRDDAWSHLDIYKELLVSGIERSLTAQSDRIKWSAWSKVLDLIRLNIVSKDYVIENRNSYWRLLRSKWVTIRKKAWRLFVTLVKEGIFQAKDKERFKDFLRHRKASVRIYAWESVPKLIQLGFLTVDEVKAEISYLEDLLRIESKVKKRALKVLKDLKLQGGLSQ